MSDADGARHDGGRTSDAIGPVFAALADPTRRHVLETLLREGSTSVPALATSLPITRQAVAKHLATLGEAGLIERAPAAGREVRYRLRSGALGSADAWLHTTAAVWDDRLARLKDAVERDR
jgi:DNA-binding transcriptional ArsR family regulator